jgi:hypothetical protein
VRVQVDKEAVNFIEHGVGACVGTVDFIDDDDRRQARFESFESTKRVCGSTPSAASTRSRMPSAILSTRSTSPPKSLWPGVSMMLIFSSGAVRLHQAQRSVLRHDGDAAFALEVHRVHDAVAHFLIGAKGVGLSQHRINKGCFAVVNVRHNRQIANVVTCRMFIVCCHNPDSIQTEAKL